ncbi:putative dsRNA-binding protein [Streptomyces sp. NPDC092903]|uniref:double-stranded RNA binding motif domain-containing protein n=1 Tax=Streptomyces sp. NPDC092903 TaxID=3366017 RepID=UPI0037F4C659
MHAQVLRLPAATVREGQDAGSQEGFLAQATLALDGRQFSGSIQRSRTRKAARQQAMTTLIAVIADLPDPLADRAVAAWGAPAGSAAPPPAPGTSPAPAQGRNPISVLHEFAQAGHTKRPDFRVTSAASAFNATVTAVHRGQKLTATGVGTTKQSARTAAAANLLELIQQALAADLAPTPEPPAAPAMPPTPGLLPPSGLAHTQEPPPALPADAAELFRAYRILEQTLADGAALTLLPARHPAQSTWMVFRPDGAPLPDLETLPAPLQPVTRDLVLAGAGGIMSRRATVTGMAVPLRLALPLLLDPREVEHASVTGWRHPLRLALTCVAQQRVHPALTDQGHGCWRTGPITEALRTAVTEAAALMAPEGHCLLAGTNPIRVTSPEHVVWPLLDAVADTLLRTPAAATLLGASPHTGAAGHDADPTPELWRWADAIEDTVDLHPTPHLVLRIRNPTPPAPSRPHRPSCTWPPHARTRPSRRSPSGTASATRPSSPPQHCPPYAARCAGPPATTRPWPPSLPRNAPTASA